MGLPGRYVGDKVGIAEGAAVGDVVGCGVGAPGMKVGAHVGTPEGAAVGLTDG